jgi:hypothetical protein
MIKIYECRSSDIQMCLEGLDKIDQETAGCWCGPVCRPMLAALKLLKPDFDTTFSAKKSATGDGPLLSCHCPDIRNHLRGPEEVEG